MGEVFAGRYELIDPIAEGGMGTVWRTLDRTDGQVKAAKILRQSDAASLLRFVREQSMRIDHLHVVTPTSWAGMDDRVLFTMPLVRGGSVATLLSDFGALPLRWVGALLDQTLQALEAVHDSGIVHRDVKPANLLLEPTGRLMPHLRLTDFGIAAPLDQPRMTRASMAIGSPGYMAPEQWHGGDPDPRQDVYAVGLVGIEMLTGIRPGPKVGPPDPDSLPEPQDKARELVAILQRASSQEPADRHESAQALRADLTRLALQDLPPDPDDTIEVFDHFANAAETPSMDPAGSTAPTRAAHLAGAAGPAPTARQQTSVLGGTAYQRLTDTVTRSTRETPRARIAALALIVFGLLCLLGAAYVVFSG